MVSATRSDAADDDVVVPARKVQPAVTQFLSRRRIGGVPGKNVLTICPMTEHPKGPTNCDDTEF